MLQHTAIYQAVLVCVAWSDWGKRVLFTDLFSFTYILWSTPEAFKSHHSWSTYTAELHYSAGNDIAVYEMAVPGGACMRVWRAVRGCLCDELMSKGWLRFLKRLITPMWLLYLFQSCDGASLHNARNFLLIFHLCIVLCFYLLTILYSHISSLTKFRFLFIG